jgi:sterol desaturase/sphingolipid hydroxylase (fatty acid hydroxylase superfamily)
MIIIYFLAWTFMLYWIHVLAHQLPVVRKYHLDHHRFINKHGNSGWQLNNLFLYNDTVKSTFDLWITEVIPTLLFSWVTGQWWVSIVYYIWAAFLQEALEHKKNFNIPLLSAGKWHLIHHSAHSKNYGLFFPIWDIIFGTYKHVDK